MTYPKAELFLFGSRLYNSEKGGDIDILILSEEKIGNRKFRSGFYKKFGWQKIDLVNFTKNDNSAFKQLILKEAKRI